MGEVDREADFGGAAGLFDVAGGFAAAGDGFDEVADDGRAGGEVAFGVGDGQGLGRRAGVLPTPGVKAIVHDREAALIADNIEGGALAAAGCEVEVDATVQADYTAARRIEAAARIERLGGGIFDEAAHRLGFEVAGEVEGDVVPVAAVVDEVGNAIDDHGLELADDTVAEELGEAAVGYEPAAVEPEGKRDGGGAAGIEETVGFGEAGGEGFVAEDAADAGGDGLLDLVGVHLLAGCETEDVGLLLLEHAAKVVVGSNVVAPAVGEGLTGIGAEVEDGDYFGIGHGVECGGEVVVGRFSVEHAMAAGDGNAPSLGHGGISCA